MKEISALRMLNQHLWGAPVGAPEDVVGWLGAMQAQEYAYAKWSVAQRAGDVDDGVDDTAIEKLFAEGAILRTHILRPTWHFVRSEDIRWLMALSGPRVNALNVYRYRQLELDDKLFTKSNALLAKALEGGNQLTRKELGAVLERAGLSADGQRLAYIVMRAELDAVVCSGARRGKQHTYALLDERAPWAEAWDRDEALAELTRRYFTSRGPATLKDYARWSSFTMADCRRGVEMVESELQTELVDERTYWFAESAPVESTRSTAIDLVQVYDEYIMGYSESRDVLLDEDLDVAEDPDAGWLHAVLLNGRLIGRWKRLVQKDAVVVEASIYRQLKPGESRALEAAVERFGRFAGLPAELVVQRVRRGR